MSTMIAATHTTTVTNPAHLFSNMTGYVIAFAATFSVILLLRPLAVRLGLVDQPGGRKWHEGNIPLLGGIAMLTGFLFALLTLDISLSPYRCLIAGTALLVVTGILDDFRELTPRARLWIQILAGVLMVWWGKNSLQSFGNLFSMGQITLGYFALPVTVFAVVAMINAVNMTDGVDGLAGSISFIEFFYLGWLCHHAGFVSEKQIIALILCVLLGFLYFNFPFRSKASVFMGDSGSMMLGFLLVWFCIYLSQSPHQAAPPAVFLWIMAVPLYDISSVVFRRLIKGFSPFKADRTHLHYYLLDKNFSSLQVTLIISLLSGITGLIGIAAVEYGMRESFLLLGFVILFLIYLGLTCCMFKKQD